jgi:16S rRNA (cytosine1402-N4)-methyltransferase
VVKAGADVLGIDADSKMLETALERLKKACPTPNEEGLGSFKLAQGNFRDIETIAQGEKFDKVEGILFDLGVSNIQLSSDSRGFSFGSPEADLDMRIDPASQGLKASDLLNGLRSDQLVSLFAKVLNPSESRFLSKLVVAARERNPFEKVGDFLRIAKRLRTKKALNPATLPFLALRMAVNSELENLAEALPKAFFLLTPKGKLLVISFHSGEEKVILDFYYSLERGGEGKILVKGLRPTREEIERNPKARSAELFVLEKI